MPYIPKHRRDVLDPVTLNVERFIQVNDLSPGDMNYILTRLVIAMVGGGEYATFEAMLGRLEAVKLEWWRRQMMPYENGKWAQNGDVFP